MLNTLSKLLTFFASTGRCPYKDLRIRQLEPCCLRSGQYCPRPMEQDSHCTRARVPYCLERPCSVVFGRISTRCEWSWLSCVTLQRYHAATQGRSRRPLSLSSKSLLAETGSCMICINRRHFQRRPRGLLLPT